MKAPDAQPSRRKRLRSGLSHAFAVEKPEDLELTDEQSKLLDRLAEKIVEWGLTAPGAIFIEMLRPLNYLGSQLLAFFEPMIRGVFDWREYTIFYQTLEKRGSVELLLDRIDHFEALRQERRDEQKAAHAEQRRSRRSRRGGKRGDHE
ncbi:MAG: hypothetical protein P9M14_05495 [Candidatus Alcyoniella australis]|nr:hypothetical protein [Candidatus Alcyoniella australis]